MEDIKLVLNRLVIDAEYKAKISPNGKFTITFEFTEHDVMRAQMKWQETIKRLLKMHEEAN